VGLNPIDWKAPDFNFGIPTLPYIAGRDLVGQVIQAPKNPSSRVQKGDIVLSPSTDYRDLRKASFQQYAIASSFNVGRLPSLLSPQDSTTGTSRESIAGLGVAFVAAALALGICFGCDFEATKGEKGSSNGGPNLRQILKSIAPESIPADVRTECLEGIPSSERPKKGDWIAIWGGSAATAKIIAQLSKLLGLRVLKVVDLQKHGEQLFQGPADVLVDSYNPERAIEIIKSITKNSLRFAIDTTGKTTAEFAQRALQYGGGRQSHLVGLTGLPKEKPEGVVHHTVPIKVFHEVREVGESVMAWLETLLELERITPIEAEIAPGGLEGINDALDRMRRGEVRGRRLIVRLD